MDELVISHVAIKSAFPMITLRIHIYSSSGNSKHVVVDESVALMSIQARPAVGNENAFVGPPKRTVRTSLTVIQLL